MVCRAYEKNEACIQVSDDVDDFVRSPGCCESRKPCMLPLKTRPGPRPEPCALLFCVWMGEGRKEKRKETKETKETKEMRNE